MTIHTCSYHCHKPDCIRAQRDYLRDKMEDTMSNKERIEALEKEMVHSVKARIALDKRVAALESMALGCRVDSLERLVSDDIPMDDISTRDTVTIKGPVPKPIDWSKVAACVPVKRWDEALPSAYVVMFTTGSFEGIYGETWWDHRSLITGIDVAWSGGECPLPEGLLIDVTLRSGEFVTGNPSGAKYIDWNHSVNMGDIISFRVTGIADGWTEEVGE